MVEIVNFSCDNTKLLAAREQNAPQSIKIMASCMPLTRLLLHRKRGVHAPVVARLCTVMV